MKKLLKFKNSLIMMLGVLLCLSGLISCSITIDLSTDNNGQVIENSNDTNSSTQNTTADSSNITIDNIPAYSGDDYIILNNNIPNFSESDLTTTSFEEYAPLDDLGRCGVAYSNIGTDIMPTEKRESISSVKPSGWHSVKYDIVEGKYLYNRSHLIGYQLTAENANDRNLITGTRYFNATLMLPYENMVADYIKETNNHVLYRVTPVFEGNNLVATGVQMEAKSVEDNGEGIEFNVFVYN
ncbi:MAG: DNA/RNA non-specific endonuclease, partial [Clostridia bacterium]